MLNPKKRNGLHSSVLYMPLRLHRLLARQLSASTHISTVLGDALWGLHLSITADMTQGSSCGKGQAYLQVSGFVH